MSDIRSAPTRVVVRLTVGAAVVLLLGALAPTVAAVGLSPAPSASPSPQPAQVETKTYPCAGYLLTILNRPDAWNEDPPKDPLPGIAVTAPDGAVVAKWQAASILEAGRFGWCRDLIGDGSLVLAYAENSGGAHCCDTWVLVRLKAPETTLLDANLRESGLTPRQLDKSAALELVASDYRLAYMGDLPFVVTSPFPRLFAYRGGRYVDATRSYPALLRTDRKKALKDLAECAVGSPDGDTGDCQKAVGLRIVALDLLLKAPTSGISRLPLDLTTRRWLLSMRAEVRRALATP
ncbi:MAG: hypothetical protein WCH74_13405 [Chloroflexota bacterium]